MELLTNYKEYILIIIITVVLGYFLGITVSTVVDYRLKDIIVNLPKPKNNITVQLADKKIDSDIVRRVKKNYRKVENFKNHRGKKHKKHQKKDKKDKKHKRTVEKFTNNKKEEESDVADPNINAYANNYKKSEKNRMDTLPFMAFNQEQADNLYESYK